MTGADARGPRTKRIRYGWIIEAVVGIALYFLYDTLRDKTMGTATDALRHAKQVVDIERFLGTYQERRIQRAFLDWRPFISFWNILYGTIHFVMPVVALVAMYRKTPKRYVRWRNALLFMLGFGLIGFWIYPLAPPRLMPHHYGFVDTAAEYFNFGPQQRIALNPHGAPPRSETSTRRCRACTSAGPHGRRWRCCHCVAGFGSRCSYASTRSR
jgi:hypothetical protein